MMTLELTLNEEQTDALQLRVDSHNAANPEDIVDAAEIIKRRVMAGIDEDVATDYQMALQRLGAAAAALPYADRKALIAQVSSQLPSP